MPFTKPNGETVSLVVGWNCDAVNVGGVAKAVLIEKMATKTRHSRRKRIHKQRQRFSVMYFIAWIN